MSSYVSTPEKREYYRLYSIRWRKANAARFKETRRIRRKRKRDSLLSILGGECCICGFNDKRVLQIDHKFGGGNQERKKLKRNCLLTFMVRESKKDIDNFKNKYQLLCANCNWIKKDENNEK